MIGVCKLLQFITDVMKYDVVTLSDDSNLFMTTSVIGLIFIRVRMTGLSIFQVIRRETLLLLHVLSSLLIQSYVASNLSNSLFI